MTKKINRDEQIDVMFQVMKERKYNITTRELVEITGLNRRLVCEEIRKCGFVLNRKYS